MEATIPPEPMQTFAIDRSLYDNANEGTTEFQAEPGLSESVVRKISKEKNEPEWMLKLRLQALKSFNATPIPAWGPDLSKLDLSKIIYYVKPGAKKNSRSWEEVPEKIRRTFEKIGIPEAERRALSGAGAQYDSEIIYHNLKKEWEEKGVIFENMDVAVHTHPDLVRKYFMKCIPPDDHKFIMLHAAVWSGGTFIYVPPHVKVDVPLQAYFRMNAEAGGQFEHTLIIADTGAEVHYIEGCSAPQFDAKALHAGCVELFVMEGARIRYSSVENWSKNTYNLNTKRAIVESNGIVEWINGNLGSGCTMLYPCSILKGDGAASDSLGIAFAGPGQNQDTGSKVIHLGRNTHSTIRAKSISKGGGISSYRGYLRVAKTAENSKSSVVCDALLIDKESTSNTYPFMKIDTNKVDIAHEATVGKIGEDEIFYLMSRGLSEEQAMQMIVSGFIEPIVKQLPLEYAVELNKLIALEMEGSVG
ncbi:MAG TPA: Fe-S cluster assembly protein SufB [Candidatus Nanoarchaeia archaeon]|nr:Fe-S cluster assembly protein SufB [Candidatus Nanoarchaeia archaeon]